MILDGIWGIGLATVTKVCRCTSCIELLVGLAATALLMHVFILSTILCFESDSSPTYDIDL